ncbi:hypothetical protein KAR91_05305 [Candidatus Pacearchaeota archaeon]|nr:hypothetical protein [Candidatus Pacearchaeota archaeon]
MKQIRVSDDAHVEIMDSFSNELRTVADIVDNIFQMAKDNQPTQSTDVDYSQCPNCEKLQEQLDAQDDTIEGLKIKKSMPADLVTIDEQVREINLLKKDLDAMTKSFNDIRKDNGEKYDREALLAGDE